MISTRASTSKSSGSSINLTVENILGSILEQYPTPPPSATSPTTQETKPKRKRNKRKSKQSKSAPATQESPFEIIDTISPIPNSSKPIYCVKFNYFIKDRDIFAAAVVNKVMVYECLKLEEKKTSGSTMKQLASFVIPDRHPIEDPIREHFYTLDWSYDNRDGNSPVLAAAGEHGIIRLMFVKPRNTSFLIGHTGPVFDLIFHPTRPQIIASAGKDSTVRLWNIFTETSILVFSGLDLRLDVLSLDFELKGRELLASGMDGKVAIWDLTTDEIRNLIEASDSHSKELSFPSKRFYHTDLCFEITDSYLDNVIWFADNSFITRSCEEGIKIWLHEKSQSRPIAVHEIEIPNCDIWFMRLRLDLGRQRLVIGDHDGKIINMEFDVENVDIKVTEIVDKNSTTIVRDMCFSFDGKTLIACNEAGKILRYMKK